MIHLITVKNIYLGVYNNFKRGMLKKTKVKKINNYGGFL